jgi:hypothetical protein
MEMSESTKTKVKAVTAKKGVATSVAAVKQFDGASWGLSVRLWFAMIDAYQSVTKKSQSTHNAAVGADSGRSESWVAKQHGIGRWCLALVALGMTRKQIEKLDLDASWAAAACRKKALEKKGLVVPKVITADWLKEIKAWDVDAVERNMTANRERIAAPTKPRKPRGTTDTKPKADDKTIEQLIAGLSNAERDLLLALLLADCQNRDGFGATLTVAQVERAMSASSRVNLKLAAIMVEKKAAKV